MKKDDNWRNPPSTLGINLQGELTALQKSTLAEFRRESKNNGGKVTGAVLPERFEKIVTDFTNIKGRLVDHHKNQQARLEKNYAIGRGRVMSRIEIQGCHESVCECCCGARDYDRVPCAGHGYDA
ncbi:MAG: hypothetical protein LBP35_06600 [Candidatus Ancillula trichonymphae]|jgi:hypothetical protein|nr:hypothetical protein [Candidatus Ancillula trichonymphae]